MATRTGRNLNGLLFSVLQTAGRSCKETFGASRVYGNILPSKFASTDETDVLLGSQNDVCG